MGTPAKVEIKSAPWRALTAIAQQLGDDITAGEEDKRPLLEQVMRQVAKKADRGEKN